MIKFQNMGLQKLVILGDLGDKNFYVMKSFPIDTNTLKYCQNSKFVKILNDLIIYCGPYSLY